MSSDERDAEREVSESASGRRADTGELGKALWEELGKQSRTDGTAVSVAGDGTTGDGARELAMTPEALYDPLDVALSTRYKDGGQSTTDPSDKPPGKPPPETLEGDGKPPGKPPPEATDGQAPTTDRLPVGDGQAQLGHYAGERITRKVEPANHQVQSGEDLASIAATHLGPGASQEEIDAHVREIARLNNIDDPANLTPGAKIELPGHTLDGGVVRQDKTGNRTTEWLDGTVRVQNIDGTGYVHRPDGSEHHWGPRAEQNYDRTPDGRHVAADRSAESQIGQPAGPIGPERQRLDQLVEQSGMSADEKARFRIDMEAFDRRCHERQPPIPQEQIEQTYHQVARLIETPGDAHVSHAGRLQIAEQVMHHAADPTTVDQGNHNTCNVATVESRMYTRNPAAAAKLVADVATTGQFVTAGGQPLSLDATGISTNLEPPSNASRDHASQIFQVAAVNAHYAYHGVRDAYGNEVQPPGTARYMQGYPQAGAASTGEYLMDTRTGQIVGNHPGVLTTDLDDISYQLSGVRDAGFLLAHPFAETGDQWTNQFSEDQNRQRLRDGGCTPVESEQELQQSLARMKQEGNLPAVIMVHTQNEPFWGDSNYGTAGGSGGWHVVTVTDYDATTHRVSIDNQWGESNDHFGAGGVHTRELYLAMRDATPDQGSSEAIATLEHTVQWNRDHNTVSGFKELDLLRLRRDADTSRTPEEEAEFDRQIVEVMRQSQERWRRQEADHTLNPRERERTIQKYRQMLTALSMSSQNSPQAQARVAQIQQGSGVV